MKKKKSLPKKRSSSKKISPRRSIRTFTTVVILSSLLVAALNIPVTKALTRSSQSQSVLGEEAQKTEEHKDQGKQEEQKNEQEKKQEEHKNEEQKKSEEIRRESSNNNAQGSTVQSTNNFPPPPIKMRVKIEGNKKESEIEGPNGQKIKTKVEDDGVTKIEAESNGLKLKYVIENGKTKLKIENESGQEQNPTEDQIQKLHKDMEDELEREDIHIATEDGAIKLRKKNVTAESHFPLSVNVETKQLVVTTPNGQKVVTVLPDQAIDNLLATGVVSKIEGQSSSSANLESDIKLEEKNNEVVYRVKGEKNKKLFGVFPVSTPVTAFVSAESGIPVATEQSLLSTLIDTFSR